MDSSSSQSVKPSNHDNDVDSRVDTHVLRAKISKSVCSTMESTNVAHRCHIHTILQIGHNLFHSSLQEIPSVTLVISPHAIIYRGHPLHSANSQPIRCIKTHVAMRSSLLGAGGMDIGIVAVVFEVARERAGGDEE